MVFHVKNDNRAVLSTEHSCFGAELIERHWMIILRSDSLATCEVNAHERRWWGVVVIAFAEWEGTGEQRAGKGNRRGIERFQL